LIENYFNKYVERYHKMKRALKRYVDAKLDFYTLTGTNYDDVKVKGVTLGFDDLIGNIEDLYNTYLDLSKKCEEERNKCLIDIDKLEKPIHRAIIEYIYLDFETNNKRLTMLLKKYYKKDYSLGYISELKSVAEENFRKILQNLVKS